MKAEAILLANDTRRSTELCAKVAPTRGSDKPVITPEGTGRSDLLFGTNPHAGRDLRVRPRLVSLDPCVRRIRADGRTGLPSVAMSSATSFPGDVAKAYRSGASALIGKVASMPRPEMVRQTVRLRVDVDRTSLLSVGEVV